MASEMVADIHTVHDENLLRKMWQETEDFARKKEIRAHMYKLRENRLKEFYTGEMDAGIGLTKTPMQTSHGDSIADHSFQSLKTKEIRDSASPTRDYKFGGNVVAPDVSGWNVVTSTEVSDDGKTEKLHTLATTGGVQELPGGKSSFAGKNEQLSSVHHDGDDKNYTTSVGHSSNTRLEENTVTGDENSGRKESKSVVTSSSSTSSRTVSKRHESTGDQAIGDHKQYENEFNDMLRSVQSNQNVNQTSSNVQKNQSSSTKTTSSTQKTSQFIQNEIDNNQHQQQQQLQREQNLTNDHQDRVNREESTTRIVRSSDTLTKDARTEEAFRLASLPGEIISRKIDYPNANTKMITEKKQLDDGTVVTTTRYETRSATTQMWTSPSDKKESTTSRTITEDRAKRDRTEVIYDDQNVQTTTSIQQQKQNDQTNRTNSRTEIIIHRDDIRDNNEIRSNKNDKYITKETQIDDHTNRDRVTGNQKLQKQNDYNVITTETTTTTDHRTVKKDLSRKPGPHEPSQSYAPSEVSDLSPTSHRTFDFNKTETTTQTVNKDKRQEQQYHSNKRISVEVDSAHDAFARSLRSVSPTFSTRSNTTSQSSLRSAVSPDKQRFRRSPSRESDTSKISSNTITKGRSDVNPDYRRPTVSSDRRSSKEIQTSKKSDKSKIESSEIIIEINENRPEEPETPKDLSPVRKTPSSPTKSTPITRRSPTKPTDVTQQVRSEKTTNTTRKVKPRNEEPPQKDYDTDSARSTSPTCTVSDIEYHQVTETTNLVTDIDSEQILDEKSTKPKTKTPSRGSSPTKPKQKTQDTITIETQKITRTENKSPKVRKSSIKKAPADYAKDVPDSEDDDSENEVVDHSLNESDFAKITTTTTEVISKDEVDVEVTDRKEPKKKAPFTRSETFEERCRQILGMDKEETVDQTTATTNRKGSKTTDTVDFISTERQVEEINRNVTEPKSKSPVRKTSSPKAQSPTRISTQRTTPSSSPDRKPVKKTTNESPRSSPSSSPERKSIKTSKNDFSTVSITKKETTDRVQKIRDTSDSSPERKEKPSQRSPSTRSPTRKEYITETVTTVKTSKSPGGSPTRPQYSSPDRSPTRPEKPTERTSPARSPTRKEYVTETVTTVRTSKSPGGSPTRPQYSSPERSPTRPEKPAERTSPARSPTRKEYVTETVTTVKTSKSPGSSPTRSQYSSPERSPTRPKQSKPISTSPSRKPETYTGPKRPSDSHPAGCCPARKPKDSSPERYHSTKRPSETSKYNSPKASTASPSRKPTEKLDRSPVSPKRPSELSAPLKSTPNQKSSPAASPTRKTPTDTIQKRSSQTTIQVTKKTSSSPSRVEKSPVRKPETETTKKPTQKAQPEKSPVRKSSIEVRKSSVDTRSTSTTRKSINVEESTTKEVVDRRSSFKRVPETTKPGSKKPEALSADRKHISTAKINITSTPTKPIKIATITTKVTDKTTKPTKKSGTHSDYSSDIESEKETPDVSEAELLAKTATKRFNRITERKESAPVYKTTRNDKDSVHKMSRSVSDNTFKSGPRRRSKPDAQEPNKPSDRMKPLKTTDYKRTKCVTTKTINLSPNKISTPEQDVIIDIQHAKSSREQSPNRLIPVPASPEDDTGHPRYPDEVQEPEEDIKKRGPKIKNVPIYEEETQDYIHCSISEVPDEDEGIIDDSAMVIEKNLKNKTLRESIEKDECMLSVSDKVSKFINTAEEVKKPRTSAPFQPKRENLTNVPESDECLLSVNEKVSKFITTAEEVRKPKTSTQKDDIDNVTKVNEKVAKFLETAEKVTKTEKVEKRFDMRTESEEIDESLIEDECLMSVSDKVNKFITTAEKLQPSPTQKAPELVAKIHRQVSLRDDLLATDDTVIEDEISEDHPRKGSITDRYSPREKPVTSTPITLRSTEAVKKAKAVFEKTDSPKQIDILSRPSVWEGKKNQKTTEVKLQDIGVLKKKDTQTSKTTTTTTETVTEGFYLSQPDEREAPRELDRAFAPSKDGPKPNDSVPAYMRDTVSSRKNLFEKKISSSKLENEEVLTTTTTISNKSVKPQQQPKERSPIRKVEEKVTKTKVVETEAPNYESVEPVIEAPVFKKHMYTTPDYSRSKPDQKPKSQETFSARRTLFEPKTPESPVPSQTSDGSRSKPSYMSHTVSSLEHIRKDVRENVEVQTIPDEETQPKNTPKFGVSLKRTNSEEKTPKRKISNTDIPHIEGIFDIELLETMLETISGYEYRRRIRNQIRLVKKQLEETTIIETVKQKTPDRSPVRTPKRTESPTKPLDKSPVRKTSPQRKSVAEHTTMSSKVHKTSQLERKSTQEEITVRRSRSPSPRINSKTTITTTVVTEKLDKPKFKEQPKEDKPIWAQKNILKKASENTRTFSSTKKIESKPVSKTKYTEPKSESRPTDCVTSSYGIGPTDDDGRPIFGLRALKKKPESNTKVTETIVQESYYSENGAPPKGERTVTVYSNDENELRKFDQTRSPNAIRDKLMERENSRNKMISLTRTEKINTEEELEPSITTTKTTKTVRRGSVKEMSEKFIQKESESTKTNGVYPKAGLILRTQNSSRSSTPNDMSSFQSGSIDFDENDVEIRSKSGRVVKRTVTSNEFDDDDEENSVSTKTMTTTTTTRSFLNSAGEKVTDVQDVLQRMKNADNVEENGDSAEDREARSLLNKFLGASVLMSGVESMMGPREVTIVTKPSTQVTKTVTSRTIKQSGAAPTTTTTTVVKTSNSDIDQIFDEVTLKKLLEEATTYDERRKLRARIKEVMADKGEVVSETTKKSTLGDGSALTTTTKVTTTRTIQSNKPISPFAKFRQLDKQNAAASPPNSPLTPTTPKTPGQGTVYFKFTDPALNARAATVKEQILQWCQSKTQEYENVQITNFSSCWTDGLAFCALIHHFLPDAFDYNALTPQQRRHNFTLAFRVADEQAGIAPLLDVEDMVVMRKPDWKCVFTYVQSIYRRFRNVQ